MLGAGHVEEATPSFLIEKSLVPLSGSMANQVSDFLPIEEEKTKVENRHKQNTTMYMSSIYMYVLHTYVRSVEIKNFEYIVLHSKSALTRLTTPHFSCPNEMLSDIPQNLVINHMHL